MTDLQQRYSNMIDQPHYSPEHAMMSPMTLSVLVPAKDEAENIGPLLDEIFDALKSYRYEVIVVNDGSTDRTAAILSRYAAQHRELKVIYNEESLGQSTSVWKAARVAKGEWLATLDGDGQNDPYDLPAMLHKAVTEHIDLIAGHRIYRRDVFLKRLSSKVANGVRSTLLKDSTPDTGCGTKLIRRETFLTLPYFNHMHRFLPALVKGQGGSCISLAVNDRPRLHGESHYGLNNRLWAGLIDMLGVMWLNRRSRLAQPRLGHIQSERALEASHPFHAQKELVNK